jgi:putative SOS response-associated peptidase YedK
MCGRYLTPDEAAFERYWELKAPAGYRRSYNVAPSQQAPIILRARDGRPTAELLTWGFHPAWAERTWINARSETVFTSKAFASAAEQRRCLVPALGWYEWQGKKAPKQPFLQYRAGLEPLAFAGIWTGIRTDEGWRRSFAILTRPATAPLRAIHDRMPAVVEPADYASWLALDTSQEGALGLLLGGEPDIAAYPISTYVNKPEHDDARCIEPLLGGELA